MLGHGAGIGYTGPGPRMGPTDNFSLVTGSTVRCVNVFTVCMQSSQLKARPLCTVLYVTVFSKMLYLLLICMYDLHTHV